MRGTVTGAGYGKATFSRLAWDKGLGNDPAVAVQGMQKGPSGAARGYAAI